MRPVLMEESQFETPLENLAADEVLLDRWDESPLNGLLRFWETSRVCVVVGYGNDVESEVNVAHCLADKIPIYRRCSGGGTVVLGSGCLNYSLILPIGLDVSLSSVGAANSYIMKRQRRAIQSLVSEPVTVQGVTDLTIHGVKFSGNAQRRRRATILFHGTILLHFDIALMTRLLATPSRQPDYRSERNHESFVFNLNQTSEAVRSAIREEWNVESNWVGIDLRAVSERAKALRDNPRRVCFE